MTKPETPMNPPPTSSPPSLLHLSFNQDDACFSAATSTGFRVFTCDPFRQVLRRDFDAGGFAAVEMLFRSNYYALVGGGPRPHFPPNKIIIWDDHESRCTAEISFTYQVRSVRLRRDRIVAVLESRILVNNFVDLKEVHEIETFDNPKGLCVVSQQQEAMVLVCPGGLKGQVRVEHYGLRKTMFIMAHDSRIACLALSQDGSLVATASSKGTLVRIFSTADGSLIQEVRRGADRADIYSLAFSENMQWLAVSSDKGTVHVFSLKLNDKPQSAPNTNVPAVASSLSVLKGVLPKYFNSEWSLAQFRLQEDSQYMVAFGHQTNTIVIVGMNGSFYRCEFDPVNGGEMKQLEYYNFLKIEEEEEAF